MALPLRTLNTRQSDMIFLDPFHLSISSPLAQRDMVYPFCFSSLAALMFGRTLTSCFNWTRTKVDWVCESQTFFVIPLPLSKDVCTVFSFTSIMLWGVARKALGVLTQAVLTGKQCHLEIVQNLGFLWIPLPSVLLTLEDLWLFLNEWLSTVITSSPNFSHRIIIGQTSFGGIWRWHSIYEREKELYGSLEITKLSSSTTSAIHVFTQESFAKDYVLLSKQFISSYLSPIVDTYR